MARMLKKGSPGARRKERDRSQDVMKACAAGFVLAGAIFGSMLHSDGCEVRRVPARQKAPASKRPRLQPAPLCEPAMMDGKGLRDIRRSLAKQVHSVSDDLRGQLGAQMSDPVMVEIQVSVDGKGRPTVIDADAKCSGGRCPNSVNVELEYGLSLKGLGIEAPSERCSLKVLVAI